MGDSTVAAPNMDLGKAPTVVLSGEFAENITIIPTSNSSLLIGMATLEDNPDETVLLPYIESMVAGVKHNEFDDDLDELYETQDFPPLFTATLPLDNALFFAWDYVRDITFACRQLADAGGGALALEPVRLNYARNYAASVALQARDCVTEIERLLAKPVVAASKPRRPAAKRSTAARV